MNSNQTYIESLTRGEQFTADFTDDTVYTVVSVSTGGGFTAVEWFIPREGAKPVFGRSVKPSLTVATVI